MAEKYLWKSSIFRNVTVWNNFSKVSLHFKKMVNPSRNILQTYSADAFFVRFCRIPKTVSASKVLGKCLKNVLDEVYVIVNLYCNQANPSFPKVSPLPETTIFKTPSSSAYIDSSLSMYLFLEFEP